MALSAAPAFNPLPKTSFAYLFYNAMGETKDPRDPTGATGIQTFHYPPKADGSPGTSGNTEWGTSYIFTPLGGTAGSSDTVTLAGPPKSFHTFNVPWGQSVIETYNQLVLGFNAASNVIGAPTGSARYILSNYSFKPLANSYTVIVALLV